MNLTLKLKVGFIFVYHKNLNHREEPIMFDISNLEHIVEDEITNKKIEKLRAEQEKTRAALAKAEREIERGENKIKRLTRSLSQEQRKARTHRLIERGALLESFITDAENLTNDEVKALLSRTFRGAD
jgi:predicted  nucleic acid-binding Zn-ribbon protein